MPATQRQRRYDQVMGDKEPDLTDKRFVQDLQTRLEIKYYESQLTKERQLAESEKKRMRKLVMEGVVEGDEKRRTKTDQREAEWRQFWPQNPNKTLEEYEEEKRRAEEKHHKEEVAAEEDRRHESGDAAEADAEDGGQTGAAAGGDTARSTNGQQQQQLHRSPGKYTRAQSARIRALHDEEDLEQLYQKASDLVYVMAPVPKAAKSKAAAK